MLDEQRRALRFVVGLRRFLRTPLTVADARAVVRHGLATRESSFLDVLDRAVFARPASPYARLLDWAGVERGDVAALLADVGVEGTLRTLLDADVRITLAEFKGREPIVRPGLELDTWTADFDNPLVAGVFTSQTGGSRGAPRPVMGNFASLERDAAYTALFADAHGLMRVPNALWRPVPPGRAGIHHTLQMAKIGLPVDRWFSQNRLSPARGTRKEFLYTRVTILASVLSARRIPTPEYVPLGDAIRVARWLAERVAEGRPAHLNAPATSGVRVCRAAREAGHDLTGTFFRFGGEPYTDAKADVVTRAGARAVTNYSMSEIGRVGIACAAPGHRDDVHVLTDRLAAVTRERSITGGTPVEALHYTMLVPGARALMLNVESGDYGVLTRRDCGCALGRLGLDLHLHEIRSYEKLTSEGMAFFGAELLELLERTLPARFGGAPSDYQLVEEEVDGIPRVVVVVSPRVGDVSESDLLDVVAAVLGSGRAYRGMMSEIWRDGGTFALARREPYATGAAKVLPLHVLGNASAQSAR